MKRDDFQQALKAVKDRSPKKKFVQSVEMILNFKGLNLKKPEEQVDVFHVLPHGLGSARTVCALIGVELQEQAKKHCDHFVLNDDFQKYEGKKKEVKKLASQYDYFIAQAPFMANIAKVFGRYFGPKGKMPNPKAGCVVPPNANLEVIKKKLASTIRLQMKGKPLIQVPVGREDMDETKLIDNIFSVYQAIAPKLPGEDANIRSIYLKLSMGPTIKVGAIAEVEKK